MTQPEPCLFFSDLTTCAKYFCMRLHFLSNLTVMLQIKANKVCL